MTKFGKRACFPELKAFYYPKPNIIPSENTQVVKGDRLKIDSRRRSQVRLLLLASCFLNIVLISRMIIELS